MIQITAYLRTEEDLERWKAISNKTEFLHEALNQQIETITRYEVGKDPVVTFKKPVIKTKEDAKKVVDDFESTGFIPKSYSARKKT